MSNFFHRASYLLNKGRLDRLTRSWSPGPRVDRSGFDTGPFWGLSRASLIVLTGRNMRKFFRSFCVCFFVVLKRKMGSFNSLKNKHLHLSHLYRNLLLHRLSYSRITNNTNIKEKNYHDECKASVRFDRAHDTIVF